MDLQILCLHDWCYIDSLYHYKDSNCKNNILSDFPIYQMPTQNISFADLLCMINDLKYDLIVRHPSFFNCRSVQKKCYLIQVYKIDKDARTLDKWNLCFLQFCMELVSRMT